MPEDPPFLTLTKSYQVKGLSEADPFSFYFLCAIGFRVILGDNR